MLFPQKKIIMGCEARGDADKPYLTRWTFADTRFGRGYLHIFHRSDHDVMHDHPWDFWTLVLWRGYIEETPSGSRRIWPGQFLFRPANHTHRVQLLNDRPAVTLVWSGLRKRSWFFHLHDGTLKPWRDYFKDLGC